MKLGFVIPNFPNERRVALLPEHISNYKSEVIIEKGFGHTLDIDDQKYIEKGCKIVNREQVYAHADAVFNLKLTQPSDYELIKENQMLIGWTHPTGSGTKFMSDVAVPKKLVVVDLDNIFPAVYHIGKKYPIDFIPKNFIRNNSYIAGYASVYHALVSYGKMPDSNTNIAVLSPGNVSQGAYNLVSKLGASVRLFYRNTMSDFYREIQNYEIIINGIEVDNPKEHILTKDDLSKLKKGTLVIDAAADAGNAIEGTRYTRIDSPIYEENGIYFYVVNNAPSLFYRNSSYEISKAFSTCIYNRDMQDFLNLVK